ncbi:transporter [Methylobacterium sp. sgz302541]|uniref:transporter n=1 Tax=unclassified Methylobacterium TaxID=2615210 RepID=UPI003D34ABCF
MMKTWLAAGAVALSVGMTASAAYAGSVTQPGEQVGLAVGAPLPEGIYAVNTFSVGSTDVRGAADVGVNIPVLVWSTPWKVFDARIELAVAQPSVFIWNNNATPDKSILYNTFVGSFFAWDLGSNVGFSYLIGAYLPDGGRGLGAASASATIRNGFALSYTGDGWNLTANLTYGITVDPVGIHTFPNGLRVGFPNSDWLNLDLTATKTFGKFEIGAVAFGSTDLPVNRNQAAFANYQRAGQFAMGGLIGYNFGPFIAQAYVTRDVVTRDQVNALGFRVRTPEETRGWVRFIIPLYTPTAVAAAPAPLVRKY